MIVQAQLGTRGLKRISTHSPKCSGEESSQDFLRRQPLRDRVTCAEISVTRMALPLAE